MLIGLLFGYAESAGFFDMFKLHASTAAWLERKLVISYFRKQ